VANPMRLSATPVNRFDPPPHVGEHTNRILAEVLGLDAEAIEGLRKDGVVWSRLKKGSNKESQNEESRNRVFGSNLAPSIH